MVKSKILRNAAGVEYRLIYDIGDRSWSAETMLPPRHRTLSGRLSVTIARADRNEFMPWYLALEKEVELRR